MQHTSNPAIVGAMLGAGIGLVQYVLAMRVMARLMAHEVGADGQGLDMSAARVSKLKLTLLAKSFIVLPGVGYIAGIALGS